MTVNDFICLNIPPVHLSTLLSVPLSVHLSYPSLYTPLSSLYPFVPSLYLSLYPLCYTSLYTSHPPLTVHASVSQS